MAAPTIRSEEAAPYTGYTYGDLKEHVLNEQGLSAVSGATEFTEASALVQAKAGRFVKDGLVYLYATRTLYWPFRIKSVTAQAMASGRFGDVVCPADMGRLERVFVAGVELKPLSIDGYAANLIPTSSGGGLTIGAAGSEPSVYMLLMGASTAAKQQVLRVLPDQASTFDALFYYRANGQGLSDDGDVVYLPDVLHPLLVLYGNYRWRLDAGDVSAARALWDHLEHRLEELSYIPAATGMTPVVHSTLPVENATRR